MSATPVREAMLDLVRDGFVVPLKNRGFEVTQVSDAELDEITELRLVLEPPIMADLARQGLTPEVFRDYRALAKSIFRAADSGRLADFVELDRQFHLGLMSLVDAPVRTAIVADLRSRTRLYGIRALHDRGALCPTAQEHFELLDLLSARDPDGARANLTKHIAHVRGVWAGSPE